MAVAIPGVIAFFLFNIVPNAPDIDEWLWVVVGDLPPAYLVTDDAKTVNNALKAYIYEMRRWTQAVSEGKSTDDLIPVNVQPTIEAAKRLEERLAFLESEVLAKL